MKENESDWELDPEFEKRDALQKSGNSGGDRKN